MSERSKHSREMTSRPTKRQVQLLTAECLVFSHRHNKFTRLNPREQVYTTKSMSHYRAARVYDAEPFGYLYQDTYSAIAKLAFDGSVEQLKVINGLQVVDRGSVAGKFLQTYNFTRSNDPDFFDGVRTYSIGDEAKVPLEDINLDNVTITSDIAEHFSFENEYTTITSADFDVLAAELRHMIRQIDDGKLAYSEVKKDRYEEYFDE